MTAAAIATDGSDSKIFYLVQTNVPLANLWTKGGMMPEVKR
jgi:hypothetical protein